MRTSFSFHQINLVYDRTAPPLPWLIVQYMYIPIAIDAAQISFSSHILPNLVNTNHDLHIDGAKNLPRNQMRYAQDVNHRAYMHNARFYIIKTANATRSLCLLDLRSQIEIRFQSSNIVCLPTLHVMWRQTYNIAKRKFSSLLTKTLPLTFNFYIDSCLFRAIL